MRPSGSVGTGAAAGLAAAMLPPPSLGGPTAGAAAAALAAAVLAGVSRVPVLSPAGAARLPRLVWALRECSRLPSGLSTTNVMQAPAPTASAASTNEST